MKRTIILFTLLFFCHLSFAQNGSITGIQVIPRGDGSGTVDIYYSLSGNATAYNINLQVSFDGGSTYTSVPHNYLSGHLNDVSPGSTRLIIWNGMGSFPNQYSTQTQIKLTANESALNFLLSDDFESYAIGSFPSQGGWYIRYNGAGDSHQYITGEYQHSGDKSFRLHGRSNWDARILNLLSVTPPIVYFEASFFSESIHHNGHFGIHNPNVGSWGSGKITVVFVNGDIVVGNINIGQYNPTIWNTVRIKADMQNNKLSVWVNGMPYIQDQDYNYPTFQYTHFQLTAMNNSSNNIVFFDNVRVWTGN